MKNLSRNIKALKIEDEQGLLNYTMNEELKKIINYVIDHGKKSIDWGEGELTDIRWSIRSGIYALWFDVYIFTSGDVDYELQFFDGENITALTLNDNRKFDYKQRDKLLKLIRKLGVL